MRLCKLPDIAVWHPLGYHGEFTSVLIHGRAKEWQHVWMSESSPTYYFIAERLQIARSVHRCPMDTNPTTITYVFNPWN